MRMQCLCSLQPHSRHRLGVKDIMTFPWEKDPEAEREKETLTAEELRERYKKICEQRGLE